jgi:hypothetical protein
MVGMRESRTCGFTFVLLSLVGYGNSEQGEGEKDDQMADRAHSDGIEVYLLSMMILVRVRLGEGKWKDESGLCI